MYAQYFLPYSVPNDYFHTVEYDSTDEGSFKLKNFASMLAQCYFNILEHIVTVWYDLRS